ncbi:hypothetical protein [Microbacterium phosphatis]|uniref:hypothetical protein n=2 Tax=Microbacterium phosphatis TaxID=3140248 RepID=UPI00314071F0
MVKGHTPATRGSDAHVEQDTTYSWGEEDAPDVDQGETRGETREAPAGRIPQAAKGSALIARLSSDKEVGSSHIGACELPTSMTHKGETMYDAVSLVLSAGAFIAAAATVMTLFTVRSRRDREATDNADAARVMPREALPRRTTSAKRV